MQARYSRWDDTQDPFGPELSAGELPGLSKLLQRLGVEEESPGVAASALEFALEGLHLSRRLNKDLESRAGASRYRSTEPDA